MAVRLTLAGISEKVTPELVCKCSEIIMKSDSQGTSKVRAKIVLVKGIDVFAVCKKCGIEVKIPLEKKIPRRLPTLVVKK